MAMGAVLILSFFLNKANSGKISQTVKLVTYNKNGSEQLAMLIRGMLYDTHTLHTKMPPGMKKFLADWDRFAPIAANIEKLILQNPEWRIPTIALNDVQLLAPVPHPASLRDGYAFQKQMTPEFDRFPVFYFGNHQGVQGPGDIRCMPDHFDKLDFELEVAILICREGTNIPASEADEYIGGFMIMNDMSARTLQMEEMMLNLGPAKGKDFSTVLGPWLVSPDELKPFEVPCKPWHTGKSWNLKMGCTVNGKLVSSGNLADMEWTLAEIIERASYGTTLYPGDIIGSGTVGTGCFLELNGTGKLKDKNYTEQWLKPGDEIEMEIEGLGKLKNKIVQVETDYSLFKLKK
jgi:fumarylacetoacetate (FAA) hydrolase